MKKLIEIALFTPDVKRTIEFYRKFLGENPAYESEESAEFKLGETRLFIHAKDERDEDPQPNFPKGVDHIAFGVEDLEEACEELRSQGIRAEIGPRDFYWGRSHTSATLAAGSSNSTGPKSSASIRIFEFTRYCFPFSKYPAKKPVPSL